MKNATLSCSFLLVLACLAKQANGLSYMYGVLESVYASGSCTAGDYDVIQATMIDAEDCAGALMNITFDLPPEELFEVTTPSEAPSVSPSTMASSTPTVQSSTSPSSMPSATPSLRGSESPSGTPSTAPSPEDIFTRRDLEERERRLQFNFCSACCSQPALCIPFPFQCNCNRRLEEEQEEEQEKAQEKVHVNQQGVQRRATTDPALEAQAEAHWHQCWDDRQQAMNWAITVFCRRALRVATTQAIAHIEV